MLERIRERFGWLDTPLAVHQRVGDVGGGPLASSIALAGFLSLFPLLLVGVAVVGFISHGSSDFPAEVVEELGLTGRAADEVLEVLATAEESRRTASIVGLAGLLWSGLGVVGTLEQALNATWQVTGLPGWKSKLVDLAWLAGAGALFLGSMALGPAATALPGPAVVPTVLLGLAIDTILLVWMFRTLTAVSVPWSDHLPGAILGAIGLEVLKLVGGIYVPRAVASASALYGSIGIVFAILAWMAISARLIVYASAYNVVRHEQNFGTVTVSIQVPRIEGEAPVLANRGGAVSDAAADTAAEDDEPGWKPTGKEAAENEAGGREAVGAPAEEGGSADETDAPIGCQAVWRSSQAR